jgi:hypothetical protein
MSFVSQPAPQQLTVLRELPRIARRVLIRG